MKDVAHHLRHIQKKIIRSSRQEQSQAGLNNHLNGTRTTQPVKSMESEKFREARKIT